MVNDLHSVGAEFDPRKAPRLATVKFSVAPGLATEKNPQLQPYLQVENVSCNPTCNSKMFQLQLHLQLEKNSITNRVASKNTQLQTD